MSKTAFVVLSLLAAQPVFAQKLPALGSSARFGALRPQSDPYRTLFQTPPVTKNAVLPAVKEAPPKRTVVCGLTIVSGDPQIDPKFFVTKRNDAIDYMLRKIDPPACKP